MTIKPCVLFLPFDNQALNCFVQITQKLKTVTKLKFEQLNGCESRYQKQIPNDTTEAWRSLNGD